MTKLMEIELVITDIASDIGHGDRTSMTDIANLARRDDNLSGIRHGDRTSDDLYC